MLCCFCIGGEYAVTRPSSQSIFLSVFSADFLPTTWLWTIPLNLVVVTLYNRLLPVYGPLLIMGVVSLAVVSINLLSAALVPIYPKLIFFQFCWKDIYILLMFKQLWSMVHTTVAGGRAKALYGIIFGMGTLGSVVCSWVPGLFAMSIGSEKLFLFTLPIYAILFFAYWMSYRVSEAAEIKKESGEKVRAMEGFSMILNNRYLLGVLLLVVFMQISVALVEYQFHHESQVAYPLKDVRTAAMGKIMSLVSVVSLILQFLGSYLLVQWLGLRRSHYVVPFLLCASLAGQFFSPGFGMASLAFVLTKSIDFSLFGVIREMLFVPLKIDEKFRAKAIIDIFAYRTSKAAVSIVLLSLQFWIGAQTYFVANYLAIGVFCLWLFTIGYMFRRMPAQAH